MFEHYNMLLCGNDMFLLENGMLLLEDYTFPHGNDMFLLGTYSESVCVCVKIKLLMEHILYENVMFLFATALHLFGSDMMSPVSVYVVAGKLFLFGYTASV